MVQNTDYKNLIATTLSKMEGMQARITELEASQKEAIAVVGMGCRFPGGIESPVAYWNFCKSGQEAITEIPENRWEMMAKVYNQQLNLSQKNKLHGGFLQGDISEFDARFFSISARQAMSLDPQQRLLLEVAWEALENANLPPTHLAGRPVGVFVGITSIDNAITVYKSNDQQIDSFFGTGNALSAAAGRLSYFFNWRGPCMSIDTACASSLVAVHQAIRSLRNRECELALVGGVNLILNPVITLTLSQAGMLAPDGRCKTFDATADGYGRGEGCGVLVLKTLSAAQKNGDRILGILRGSAVNHNGSSAGLTVPSGPAQQELFRQALADARIAPQAVSYIEAHGTGTSLGDPIEMNAIAAVYGQRSHPLYVGSVKTNLGHLEAAAGMAGIIKTILMLQQGEILPQLNFHQPNPLINWQENRITVPTQTQPWPDSDQPRIAAVSAFGFAGSNAHVILEQPPAYRPTPLKQSRPSHLLTLSAQNVPALRELARRFQTLIESEPELGDLTYSAAIGRANLSERLAIVADTLPELQHRLATFAHQNPPENSPSNLTFYHRFSREDPPQIVFLFTGQGSCYPGMGEKLYQTQPTFRQALDQCAEILSHYLDFPLTAILWGEHSELLQQTAYAQPAIFALEYAITQLWQSWGVHPSLLIGHSVGEYVAACIAGVFSLEAGLELIVKRGQLMQNTAPGKMASIFADQTTVISLLENYQGQVEIAAINHPQQIVISGKPESLDQIINDCKQQKISAQYLAVTQGFHSPLMEPILAEFENTARRLTYNPPKIPLLSTLNGQILEQIPDASYWRQQSRQAVQYLASLETAINQGYTLFLEVGARPILSEQGRRYQPQGIWLSSLDKGVDPWQTLLATLGQLYVQGVPFDGEKLNQPYGYKPIQLPNYPFQRKPFQFQPNPVANQHGDTELPLTTEPAPKPTESLMEKYQLEISSQLTSILALLLQEKESDIPPDETLLNLGADSIILTDFSRKIEEKFNIKITIDQLFTNLQTIVDIAQYLAQFVQPKSPPIAPEIVAPAATSTTINPINNTDPAEELQAYLSVIAQLQPITTAYIIQALQDLGLKLTLGVSWTRENLEQNLAIAPKYQRLLTRYLDDLIQAGVLSSQQNRLTVQFLPQAFDLTVALDNLQTQCRAAQPELAMLQRCGENLAGVLQGNIDPLTLIFPEGSVTHAASIYGNSPVSRLMNQRVAQTLNQILKNFLPSDRPYQILEIGGGTGATTETLFNHLDPSQIAYSFTELSPFLLNQARQKFQGKYPITFHPLDIEKSPQAQGLPQKTYHCAIAANVLHATRNLSETLTHIRELIRPGGYLILLETVENNPWLDLTFGLTPGWWRFQDQDLRTHSPLLSGENWCSLLKRCGFATAVSLSQQNHLTVDNGQELILATLDAPQSSPPAPSPIPNTGEQALMMAQLQSLKDLQQLHEKTILKQLEILQSPPSQAIALPPVPLPTSPRPPFVPILEKSSSPRPSPPSVPAPEKPSSPRLNPLALKLTETQTLTPQQQAFIDNLQQIYNQKTAQSKAYSQNSRKTMVDVKPTIDFRLALKEFQYPIVADSAQGAHFRDLDGNDYIDLAMGFGVNFFGHSPDFVIEAVKQQMEQGISLGMQSKLAAETAALISQLGKVERVAFSNTGTEAIMGAVRIARSRTQRQKIVIFAGSYHGTFDGILARSGEDPTVALPLSLGTPPGMTQDVMVLSYGVEESLNIIANHGHELAAVLVEPVQSRKPDLQPQAFLQKLREITREKGIALIFDEIITGFRIAPGGASEWFGVEADLIIHGKAIGGGLPISVICGKADFLDTVDGGFWQYGDNSHPQTELTAFGGTFCRHPLALAACRAVLLHLQEQSPTLQNNVNQLTERLATQVNAFFEEVGIPIRLVYFGSLFRFEPFGAYSLFLQPIELPLFYYLLILKGVYTWEKRVCFLSTQHTQKDIDRVIVAVKEAILELRQAGFFAQARGSKAKKSQTPTEDDTGGDGEGFGGESFPTNQAQRQLWLLSELDQDASVSYNVITSLELQGLLEISALETALNQVVNRHEALRTKIVEQGELQVVMTAVKLPLTVVDLSHLEDPEAELLALRTEFAQKPFDLAVAPLLKTLLIRLKPEHHLLCLKTHHIVADGWSLGLILNEIGQLYSSKINQTQTRLPAPMQFRQYLALREQVAQSPQMAEHREFWLKTYGDDLPTFELPTDFPRPATKTYTGSQASQQVDPELWQKLKQVGRQHQATLFMTMFAAYTTLISRFSRQHDLVIGIPISGRQIEGSDQLVGFCSQFLPLRVQVDLTLSFVEHLQRIKQNLIATFRHQSYTLEDLLADLQLQRDFSRAPLISISFNMDPSLTLPVFEGLNVGLLPEPLGYTPFDIGFNLIELNDHLITYCNYNTKIFKPETIQQILASFEILLGGIVDHPQYLLHQFPLLTPDQEQVLLTALKGESRPLNPEATIIDDFIARVKATPQAPAVIGGKTTLSYQGLNEQVNRLAHYLQSQYQLGAGKAIAVILGRNVNLIVAILAVFKIGATYVPIDSQYPQSRIEFILRDSGCQICLTESDWVDQLPPTVDKICLDKIDDLLAKADKNEPKTSIDPNQIAYIFYTSGSTGNPKGVMGRHLSIVNIIQSLRLTFGLDHHPEWRYIFTAAITHDPSIRNIFLPLTIGAPLYLYEIKYIGHLVTFLQENQINALHTTPSIYREILALLPPSETIPSLKYISIGGEKLDPETALALRHRFRADIVSNVYGSTETCVGVSQYMISETLTTDVPLGQVFHNNRLLILDDFNHSVPLQMTGEICVEGAAVAAGYHNLPELTQEKFKTGFLDPQHTLFRTGDLGKQIAPGVIEFIGRKDHQVKVNGYRIDPEEIEFQLNRHPQIEKAIILPFQVNNQTQLSAYCQTQKALEIAGIREFLADLLPAYMIPSYFIFLKQFPLTRHGKLDLHSLVDLKEKSQSIATHYVPPRNQLESQLVTIWEKLLSQHPIGIFDNFFEIGGHSLLLSRVINHVHKELNVSVKISDFFKVPTVAGLAALIAKTQYDYQEPIPAISPEKSYPMSHGQRRLWALEFLDRNHNAYGMPSAYHFKGNLNLKAFETAFQGLIKRHEILRTTFHLIDNEPRQVVHQKMNFAINQTDLTELETTEQNLKIAEAIAQNAQTTFDLERGPLIKVNLLQLHPEHYMVLFNMHHIIADGWSAGVLIKDFITHYHAYNSENLELLPPLKVHYKDYSAWQENQLKTSKLQGQRHYWLTQLTPPPVRLNLPLDYSRPPVQSFQGKTLIHPLDPELMASFNTLVKAHQSSLFMGLLTLVKAFLFRYTEQAEITVGSAIAGRNHPDLEAQIGFYVNTLVLRDRVAQEDSFSQLLAKVKVTTLEAYENQDYPFDKIVSDLNLERDPSRNALFDVAVVLQNNQTVELDLPGITINSIDPEMTTAKFDLEFIFVEEGELYLKLIYNTDIFVQERILLMLKSLENLLTEIVKFPEQPLIQLSLPGDTSDQVPSDLFAEDFNF